MQYASENKTHVSKSFLTDEEIELLEKCKRGKYVLRIEPMVMGGRMYEIRKGGLHYATLQEVLI